MMSDDRKKIMQPLGEFLRTGEACDYLNMSYSELQAFVKDTGIPFFSSSGKGLNIFKKEDLDKFKGKKIYNKMRRISRRREQLPDPQEIIVKVSHQALQPENVECKPDIPGTSDESKIVKLPDVRLDVKEAYFLDRSSITFDMRLVNMSDRKLISYFRAAMEQGNPSDRVKSLFISMANPKYKEDCIFMDATKPLTPDHPYYIHDIYSEKGICVARISALAVTGTLIHKDQWGYMLRYDSGVCVFTNGIDNIYYDIALPKNYVFQEHMNVHRICYSARDVFRSLRDKLRHNKAFRGSRDEK